MKSALKILIATFALTAAADPIQAVAAEAMPAESVAADTPKVKVQQGGLLVEVPGESACHIVIYALTGQVVKQIDVPAGSTVIDLPAGYYIVRIGHNTVKVAVK